MNDLEMAKAMAKLEGIETHIHRDGKREWLEHIDYDFPTHSTGVEFSPIEDPVLNCMLSDKYELSHDAIAKYIEVYFEGEFHRHYYESKDDLPRARISLILHSRGIK